MITTASTARMVRSGTPLADAAAKSRSRRGASGPTSRSSRSTWDSLTTVVTPGSPAPSDTSAADPPPSGPAPPDPPAAPTDAPVESGVRCPFAGSCLSPPTSSLTSGSPAASGTCSACQVREPGRVNMRVMAGEPGRRPVASPMVVRGPFVRREVRLSVGTLLVFLFVFYVALPLLASHRAELASLAHVNIPILILGLLLEIAALVAYTQLTHTVLPPDGPRRLRLFRINMSTLALSHVSPGGTGPGAALWYRLVTQSGVSGSDAGFALGTQGIGSAVVLNVLFWLRSSGSSWHTASTLRPATMGASRSRPRSSSSWPRPARRGPARRLRRPLLSPDPWTTAGEPDDPPGVGPHPLPRCGPHDGARRATRRAVRRPPRRSGAPATCGGVGRRQLAPRRRVALGVRGRVQPAHLTDGSPHRLRTRLHPRRHPDHPRWPRRHRVRARLDDHRVRADSRTGTVGGARLPCGELLAADTLRRPCLCVTRIRAQRTLRRLVQFLHERSRALDERSRGKERGAATGLGDLEDAHRGAASGLLRRTGARRFAWFRRSAGEGDGASVRPACPPAASFAEAAEEPAMRPAPRLGDAVWLPRPFLGGDHAG